MRRWMGAACVALGILAMGASLLLQVHQRARERAAGEASAAVMPALQTVIEEASAGEEEAAESPETAAPMTVKEIDGYGYIGYLSIPALELELPVMSQWDYERLDMAPCRHAGAVDSRDLVIAGHNYQQHFGSLSLLVQGDLVLFTDMDGVTTTYQVQSLETLPPTAVDEVLLSPWDLVLYTCTYGGQNRVVVGCQMLEIAGE